MSKLPKNSSPHNPGKVHKDDVATCQIPIGFLNPVAYLDEDSCIACATSQGRIEVFICEKCDDTHMHITIPGLGTFATKLPDDLAILLSRMLIAPLPRRYVEDQE
jgi:hypothetical protein